MADMEFKDIIVNFLIGGTVTALIVGFEQSGHRILSGLATLVPVFTLVSYFLIGAKEGGVAVGNHSKLVLVGTLVSWVPYMMIVAYLAPKIGANKAIFSGLGVFFILATTFLVLADRNNWFV